MIDASQERVDRPPNKTRGTRPLTRKGTMETLAILVALATVAIPALTEAAVVATRLFAGTGAGGQHTYLRKAWLRGLADQ